MISNNYKNTTTEVKCVGIIALTLIIALVTLAIVFHDTIINILAKNNIISSETSVSEMADEQEVAIEYDVRENSDESDAAPVIVSDSADKSASAADVTEANKNISDEKAPVKDKEEKELVKESDSNSTKKETSMKKLTDIYVSEGDSYYIGDSYITTTGDTVNSKTLILSHRLYDYREGESFITVRNMYKSFICDVAVTNDFGSSALGQLIIYGIDNELNSTVIYSGPEIKRLSLDEHIQIDGIENYSYIKISFKSKTSTNNGGSVCRSVALKDAVFF